MRYLIATAIIICRTFVSRIAKIRLQRSHYAVFALIGAALVSPATAKYNVIYAFCSVESCADGNSPSYGVIKDSGGNLFGTTSRGGINNSGTIFELTNHRGKWEEKVIYRFCSENNCVDGMTPGALIIDTSGNLYGIAAERGPHDFGEVFELVPNARRTKWRLRILHGFCEVQVPRCGDGSFALGGLSYAGMASGAPYDGISPLYGTAQDDGAHGGGVVYQLTHKQNEWADATIYNFCSAGGSCADGGAPQASVFVDASSNIFGTAGSGGAFGGGVAFKLTRRPTMTNGDWKETVLYSFCALTNCADGRFPANLPVFDSLGNLYGTTSYGGAAQPRCNNGYDCGVLFKLAPNGAETVIHAFCSETGCADGAGAMGSLLGDPDEALYGTTVGVDGPGTLYKFDGTFAVLYTFCSEVDCTDGYEPYDENLITDSDGNMFGTAGAGGPHGGGVVFEWTP